MVKIQIDLSRDEDTIVEIYKLANNLPTKELAIKMMITFFKARIEPEKLRKKEYFHADSS
ncbi:MAG: hypothetical protein AABX02_00855 [archaeon]